MVPPAGGASKETGPSSSVKGEEATGLVGVPDAEVVAVVTGPELGTGPGPEPGEGGVKFGGSSLKPGLFGEGSRAVGDKTRLA